MKNPRTLTLVGLIFLAAFSRLIPHPWNVAPITAMALFAGSYFQKRWLAFTVPFGALLLSDVVLGFYSTIWSTYIAFALIVGLGFWIAEQRTVRRIAMATLGGSALFFVITNFAVWMYSGMYAHDAHGFAECYALAVPFFRNTLLGDAFYSTLMFGSFAIAEQTIPALKPAFVRV
jgi:hypothetical protein